MIGGNGTIIGTNNGDPTNHRFLTNPQRELFGSEALAEIWSGNDKSTVNRQSDHRGYKVPE